MYTVDPAFSVYHLIERIQNKSILLNHRRTMSLISYEIENATLIDRASTRLFAGFQYMSKFIPQVSRYQRLAEQAEAVYVFGVPDVKPPVIPKIQYIDLSPSDQLAREWFLISHSAEYSSALATEEVSRFSDPDEQRTFKGIWTFDVAIVTIMHDWLASLVDARPMTEQTHDAARQSALMSSSFNRLNAKRDQLPRLSRELNEAITSSQQ